MGTQGKYYRKYESDTKDEEKYSDREIVGFWAKVKGSAQETWDSRQENLGWNYYRDKYRDRRSEWNSDKRIKDDYKVYNFMYYLVL